MTGGEAEAAGWTTTHHTVYGSGLQKSSRLKRLSLASLKGFTVLTFTGRAKEALLFSPLMKKNAGTHDDIAAWPQETTAAQPICATVRGHYIL